MPIPVVCPKCQTKLNAPDAAAGKKVKCPKCADVLAVPAAATAPEPLDLPPEPPAPPAASGNPFDFAASPPPPPAAKPAPRPAPKPAAPAPPPPPPPVASGDPFAFDTTSPPPPAPKRQPAPARDPAPPPPPPPASGDPFAFDPTPAAPAPKKRSAPKAEEPADLPPEDEPARLRAQGGDGSGPSKRKVYLVIGAVVLACGAAGGFGTYLLWPKSGGSNKEGTAGPTKKSDGDAGKGGEAGKGGDAGKGGESGGGKGGVPSAWKAYAAKDGSFKGYFPVTPKEETQPQQGPKNATPTIKQYMAEDRANDLMAGLFVIKFPAAMPAPVKTATMELMAAAFGGKGEGKADTSDVTWLGEKGKQVLLKEPGGAGELVIRQALVGNTGYVGMMAFKGARKQDQVDAFFGNIEALSK